MAKIHACRKCDTIHWSIQPCQSNGYSPDIITTSSANMVTSPLEKVTLLKEAVPSYDGMTKQRRWEAKNRDRYLAWRREYMRKYREEK